LTKYKPRRGKKSSLRKSRGNLMGAWGLFGWGGAESRPEIGHEKGEWTIARALRSCEPKDKSRDSTPYDHYGHLLTGRPRRGKKDSPEKKGG